MDIVYAHFCLIRDGKIIILINVVVAMRICVDRDIGGRWMTDGDIVWTVDMWPFFDMIQIGMEMHNRTVVDVWFS